MSSYKSFAVTAPGISHTKQGKGCEDSSDHEDNDDASIAIVADGHGDDNCFRSAIGAELAVKCAKEGIREFIKDHKTKFEVPFYISLLRRIKALWVKKRILDGEKPLIRKLCEWIKQSGSQAAEEGLSIDEFEENIKNQLIKSIINSWHQKVIEHFEANKFTPEELEKADEKHRRIYDGSLDNTQTSLVTAATSYSNPSKAYGTTLIAAAVTPHYWLGIHIGDGRLTALYPDGRYDQPVPWDPRCFRPATTSICNNDAFESARCYFSFHEVKTPPVAVFLCSDGIDDNYPPYENEKYLYKLYRDIALQFAKDGFDSTSERVKDNAKEFAENWKGDDTSIAGFINMEALKQEVPNWEKQIADEEAAAKKIAAEKAAKEEAEAGRIAAEKAEKEKAQAAIKAEPEKPAAIPAERSSHLIPTVTRAEREAAIAEYRKNMGSANSGISSYGDFTTKPPGAKK